MEITTTGGLERLRHGIFQAQEEIMKALYGIGIFAGITLAGTDGETAMSTGIVCGLGVLCAIMCIVLLAATIDKTKGLS